MSSSEALLDLQNYTALQFRTIFSTLWYSPQSMEGLDPRSFFRTQNPIRTGFFRVLRVLICGNKMPTRCKRWFLYCISYCLFNMFRAPLCPSSGAQEYYTDGCCLWYLVLWFSSCRSGVELRGMCPVCAMLQHPAKRTHNSQFHTRPTTWKPEHQIAQAANICIILLSSWWWA